MSPPTWTELQVAFEAILRINAGLIEALRGPIEAKVLDALIEEKAACLALIEAFDWEAQAGSAAEKEAMGDLQKRCGRSELDWAEALGKAPLDPVFVKSVTNAYRSKAVDKLGTKGLDYST